MLKRLILSTSLGVAMLLVPATSAASTIAYDCTKCGNHNTAFDITYSVVDSAANTYQLTITALYQPAGAGAMDYAYINAIAMKLNGVTHDELPTVSGPDGGPWTVLNLGLSANGCNGSAAEFFCANSAGSGAAHSGAGDSDTWVFLLDLGAALGPTQQIHFKAHFVDANGNKVGDLIGDEYYANLFEEPTCAGGPCTPAAVPEPATLVLMGAGLSLLATRLRKRA